MATMSSQDPDAVALIRAIHVGDLGSLRRMLTERPDLATTRIQADTGGARTLLHVATDWPGYFPDAPMAIRLLVEAGADPSAPFTGGTHSETPLHWAASSDDVEVADALIDAGADIQAPGASIGGGSPLDDAVGYGCWHVARRLVERGAAVDRLWHAAALGILACVEELLAGMPPPSQDEVNDAFWQACHGGQRRTAQYLLAHGAQVNWIPHYARSTPLEMANSLDTRRETLATWLRDQGAKSIDELD